MSRKKNISGAKQILLSIFTAIDTFFFAKISAKGFGLMRVSWAAVILFYMSIRWYDIAFFYSDAGLVPDVPGEPGDLGKLVFRSLHHYTIFDYFASPFSVYVIYAALMTSCFLMLIGLWPRITTIISVLLLFSFHERNLLPLGGGDTVLRCIGFLLMICPELRSCSVHRVREHWLQWKKDRTYLPSLQMSIWPYRLAMWQLLVIYLTSVWDKMIGEMWWKGTATASALHHLHFFRFPIELSHLMSFFSPIASWGTMLWELAWIVLFIPDKTWKKISKGKISYNSVKRKILLGGVLFHGSIFVFMEVGSFSPAMLTFYLGLLLADDLNAIRKRVNTWWKKPISVIYDDKCILCRRSVFTLHFLDWLHRLEYIDFHDKSKRKKVVPHIEFDDLDKAMHIKLPDGSTPNGFDAFRAMSWHLPPLWLLVPFLYIPGVDVIGRRVYARIAKSRLRCTDDFCQL